MSYFDSKSGNLESLYKNLLKGTISNLIRTSSDKSFKIHAMARLGVSEEENIASRVDELVERLQKQIILTQRDKCHDESNDLDSFDSNEYRADYDLTWRLDKAMEKLLKSGSNRILIS